MKHLLKTSKKNDSKSKNRLRSKVKIPVQFWRIDVEKDSSKHRGHIALAKDISPEGLYVKTRISLKKGDILRLEIFIRIKRIKHIFALAEVVWTDKTGGGLHMLLLPEEDKDTLKKFLENVELHAHI